MITALISPNNQPNRNSSETPTQVSLFEKLQEDVSAIPEQPSHWFTLVSNIANHQVDAMEQLYLSFGNGVRLLIARQLGFQDVDDHVHDVFLITIAAIQAGEIRNSEALPGFIRTVTRRRIAGQIQKLVWKRNREVDAQDEVTLASTRQNPEESAIDSENVRIMGAVLSELIPRDREVLTRFYLNNESAQSICATMALTEIQFRLLKSRAKARFAEYGRKKLVRKALAPVFQRNLCFASH